MRGYFLAALLLLTGLASAHDATFLGFRLLDLENQTVKWQSPHMGVGAALTYAFATEAVDTPGARNCAKLVPPEKAYRPLAYHRRPVPPRGGRGLPHLGGGRQPHLPRGA